MCFIFFFCYIVLFFPFLASSISGIVILRVTSRSDPPDPPSTIPHNTGLKLFKKYNEMHLFVELRSLKILNRDIFFSFEKIGKKSTLLSKVHNSFQIFEHCNLPRSLRTQ